MSRTKRKYRDWENCTTTIKDGSDSRADYYNSGLCPPTKLAPYVLGKWKVKFKPTGGRVYTTGWMKHITNYDKLITKNANRSQKKALRQFYKKQIKKELYDTYINTN